VALRGAVASNATAATATATLGPSFEFLEPGWFDGASSGSAREPTYVTCDVVCSCEPPAETATVMILRSLANVASFVAASFAASMFFTLRAWWSARAQAPSAEETDVPAGRWDADEATWERLGATVLKTQTEVPSPPSEDQSASKNSESGYIHENEDDDDKIQCLEAQTLAARVVAHAEAQTQAQKRRSASVASDSSFCSNEDDDDGAAAAAADAALRASLVVAAKAATAASRSAATQQTAIDADAARLAARRIARERAARASNALSDKMRNDRAAADRVSQSVVNANGAALDRMLETEFA